MSHIPAGRRINQMKEVWCVIGVGRSHNGVVEVPAGATVSKERSAMLYMALEQIAEWCHAKREELKEKYDFDPGSPSQPRT